MGAWGWLTPQSVPNSLLVDQLFFICAAPHLVLHSFPTRRSSDLSGRARACPRGRHRSGRRRRRPCRRSWGSPPRSEEHTSELQSPYDLVCRLLLEKKNVPRVARTIADLEVIHVICAAHVGDALSY